MIDPNKPNAVAHKAIMEAVDNQLNSDELPEAKQTLDRLLDSGIDMQEARRLLALVLAQQIYLCLKTKTEYNRDEYIRLLNGLPATPWLDE